MQQKTSRYTMPHIKNFSRTSSLTADFIRLHPAGALATVGMDGSPHIATVYCLARDDTSVYFSTAVEADKYRNLSAQPYVALCFYDESSIQQLQVYGLADRVESPKEEQKLLDALIALRIGKPDWPPPPLKLYESGLSNELAVIRVTPTRSMFTDFGATAGQHKAYFQQIL